MFESQTSENNVEYHKETEEINKSSMFMFRCGHFMEGKRRKRGLVLRDLHKFFVGETLKMEKVFMEQAAHTNL